MVFTLVTDTDDRVLKGLFMAILASWSFVNENERTHALKSMRSKAKGVYVLQNVSKTSPLSRIY